MPCTLNDASCTFNDAPFALRDEPCTFNGQPFAFNDAPVELRDEPFAFNGEPDELTAEPEDSPQILAECKTGVVARNFSCRNADLCYIVGKIIYSRFTLVIK